MRAKRTSRCELCGFNILPGDIIVCLDEHDEWVHRDCAMDSGDPFSYDDDTEED